MIECIKAISQGFSHKKLCKPCQDAVSVVQKKGYAIISVADGHGGERYFRSGIGSQIAVEIAEQEFGKLLADISKRRRRDGEINWEQTIKALENNIVKEWQNKVEKDFQIRRLNDDEIKLVGKQNIKFDNPSDEYKKNEEICDVKFHNMEILKCYGTTLLSALYIPVLQISSSLKSFWIAIQIGDGWTFALDETDSEYKHPSGEDKKIPLRDMLLDENLGFGYTTSLCSSNAAEKFRYAYGFSRLNALVVCSDGVADSFEKEKFGGFVRMIRNNITEKGRNAVQEELQAFLPNLSEQGSGDDVSLAGVFWREENKRRT